MLAQMKDLRDRASNGTISQSDYTTKINDLVNRAWNFRNEFASHGAQYANQVVPQFNQIIQEGFATSNGRPNTTIGDPFSNTPYKGSSVLADLQASYKAAGKPPADAARDIQSYTNTFKQMFTDKVGREPTAQEYDNFLQSVVVPDQPWSKSLEQPQLQEQTRGLLSDFYTGEAQKTAAQKLQDEATSALAPGSAFDIWQKAYMGAANDVEKNLLDYQSKLFEKIRPQLLTSLQAQGLLDTGGLNKAIVGAQTDLANSAGQYAAGVRQAAATDVANQRYQVASAPSLYKTQAAFGAVPNLTAAGQSALQNVYNNMVNTNYLNATQAFQREMYDKQLGSQPSLLSQYGGMILGGMAGGAGQALGQKLIR